MYRSKIDIANEFMSQILDENKAVILSSEIIGDDSGLACLSMLFHSTDRYGVKKRTIAHQFEENFTERIYPNPDQFIVVEVMPSASAADLVLKQRAQLRDTLDEKAFEERLNQTEVQDGQGTP